MVFQTQSSHGEVKKPDAEWRRHRPRSDRAHVAWAEEGAIDVGAWWAHGKEMARRRNDALRRSQTVHLHAFRA